jgi:magnesium-transporting ATPase (P-type)
MYHSDPIRPLYTPEVTRSPQQQASHDQAKGEFLDAIAHMLWWVWAIGPIVLAGKAGFNWHELTGDKGAAAERGAQALVRWKWFQFATVASTVSLLGGWTSVPSWMTFMNITLWWCLAFWLVIYVRLAEFSLFRRGPIQWVMTPITRALDNVNTWAIVVAALLPAPFALYLAITV